MKSSFKFLFFITIFLLLVVAGFLLNIRKAKAVEQCVDPGTANQCPRGYVGCFAGDTKKCCNVSSGGCSQMPGSVQQTPQPNGSTFTGLSAFPEPIVPCEEQEFSNPEYNSLRPYQASTCGDSIKAYYCQNDYKIEEKVSVEWNPIFCSNEGGSRYCKYNKPPIKRNYEITIADAQIPILGNTQEVLNSQSSEEKIDDAQKMNEYLSWYLSGVNQKPEYGSDTADKTVNYSGPLKKLLPSVIQEFQRFEVLRDAGVKDDFITEKNGITESQKVRETSTHNQIVVCTTKNIFGIDNPWIGQEKPIPCYDGDKGKINGKDYRLVDWWEGKRVGYLEAFEKIPGWDGKERWDYTTPPFPWQFEKDIYYQKAYQEWRGHECLILFDKLMCADLKIPGVAELHTNKWADFYQYIPLADMVDKNAKHLVGGLTVRTGNNDKKTIATINKDYKVEQETALSYPHSQSTYTQLNLLNKTIKSASIDSKNSPQGGIEPSTCQVVDVRSNSGDNIAFTNTKNRNRIYITGVVIGVEQIECQGMDEWFKICKGIPNPLSSEPKCRRFPSCDNVLTVTIPTTPKIPFADYIWNESVAGVSPFRQIFPKVEEGSPVSCIADIPGVSKPTYLTNKDTNLIAIDTAGGREPADDAKLYFPHLGGVYEYFLKGIQTALRPKGYGEPLVSSQMCETSVACGDWESKLGDSGGSCGICNAPIGNLAKKILTAAGKAYNVPAANIWAAMKHEGGDWTEFNGFKDEDVRKWSTPESCGGEPMPRCDNNNDITQPPFGFLKKWFYLGDGNNALWSAVQVIDPARNSPEKVSRCNFLDAAFAAAKLLNQSASNTTAGPSCGSYSGFNTTSPGTCSSAFWTDTKVAQSQNGYAGYCVNDTAHLYTIEQAVGWYKEAACK